MADPLKVEKPVQLDILDTQDPKLSSTNDMPVIETKPDVTVPKKDAEAAPEVVEEQPSTEQPEVPAASDEPKKAKGVQKRIDELVTQREDNRRRAEAAESRLDRALQALERATGAPAKETKDKIEKEDPEPQKPVRASFTDPDTYDQALENYVTERASWIARKEVNATLAEERRKYAEAQAQETQKKVQETYRERLVKIKEKYADFSEVAESPDIQISIPMAHAILTSEQGPEIQYYLGKNSAEATRISSLSPELQLLELGMIAAGLRQPTASKPVSSAPAPGKPIKTTGEAEPSLEDLPMEEYAKKVREREAAKRKPGGRLYS
jgi:hypothetical protein